MLAPQLEDWREPSVNQTIALVEYFLSAYRIDPEKVYINGYSGGGETLSLVLEKRPELFAAALHASSQWDGDLVFPAESRTPFRTSMAGAARSPMTRKLWGGCSVIKIKKESLAVMRSSLFLFSGCQSMFKSSVTIPNASSFAFVVFN